jgi:hypothetical protein
VLGDLRILSKMLLDGVENFFEHMW